MMDPFVLADLRQHQPCVGKCSSVEASDWQHSVPTKTEKQSQIRISKGVFVKIFDFQKLMFFKDSHSELRLRNHLFRQEFTNNNEIEKIF